jgi:formylglycine-generating enzyme required for sulfatase activity
MKNINQMTSREAMGLPLKYHESIFESKDVSLNYWGLSKEELLDILISTKSNLTSRCAAGTILGLLGDDRIDVLNPSMINIPQAEVCIGSDHNEINNAYKIYKKVGVKKEWLLKECPKHNVFIHSFRIGKYPITNYEYLFFLKDTDYVGIPSSWKFGVYDPLRSNHPVYGVTPQDADAYVIWISKKTNRKFRLPREYEWEYAAAGHDGREFPWGNIFSSDLTNTLESKIYSTTPIGIFPAGASSFGCMDMAGNVEEFVENNYFAYPSSEIIKDDLNKSGDYRIARGGSFTRYADLARCRRRHGFYNKEIYVMGFRLAETI